METEEAEAEAEAEEERGEGEGYFDSAAFSRGQRGSRRASGGGTQGLKHNAVEN